MEEGEGSGDRDQSDEQNQHEQKTVGEPQNLIVAEQTGSDDTEMAVEDMELGELDLEGIEKAYNNPKTGYIPFSQIALLKEVIIKTKGVRGLGVVSESMKGGEGRR